MAPQPNLEVYPMRSPVLYAASAATVLLFALAPGATGAAAAPADHLKPCQIEDVTGPALCGTYQVWEDREARRGRRSRSTSSSCRRSKAPRRRPSPSWTAGREPRRPAMRQASRVRRSCAAIATSCSWISAAPASPIRSTATSTVPIRTPRAPTPGSSPASCSRPRRCASAAIGSPRWLTSSSTPPPSAWTISTRCAPGWATPS